MSTTFLTQGYFIFFLIASLGLILGNMRIKGFSLDVSAVIFVALAAGHFGLSVPTELQTFGLVLFMFTIGLQAGPGFFEAFKKYGRSFILLSLGLVSAAALITLVLIKLTGIDTSLAIGIFNGALTSTPGLAAAIDITGSPLASIGYGIAYPLGVIGVILFIHFAPAMLKSDLKAEETQYEQQVLEDNPPVINRNFVVENSNIDGKSIRQMGLGEITKATISRVKQGEKAFTPDENTHLYLGNIIKAVGTEAALEKVALLIGRPTNAEITLHEDYRVSWVLVTNKEVINHSLAELSLRNNYHASITRIRRSGIDISPRATSRLRFGDKVLLACPQADLPRVMKLLGNDEKRLSETNFLPITLGILLGIVVGSITVPVFGLFGFSLGITGGVLTVGLVLSRLGKTGPIIWSMSGSANQLVRKLGLLMFLSVVGTQAGAHLADTLADYGIQLFAYGAIITLLPMLIFTFVGKRFFGINMISLLGSISGAMTSTPGLAAIDSKTSCEAASVAYATVYPAALVMMIVFSQLLSML